MTDEEKELLRAGADAAIKPFGNLIERLFGGAVDEIGGTWQDRLKLRRFKRRLKLYEEIDRSIKSAGFEPIEIPERIWFPALSAASLNDDADLQRCWATLLINAADPEKQPAVLPAFVDILSQLSPKEALFMRQLYQDAGSIVKGEPRRRLGDRSSLISSFTKAGLSYNNMLEDPERWMFTVFLGNLLRLQLLSKETTFNLSFPNPAYNRGEAQATDVYFVSDIGNAFVELCLRGQGPA
ncbi:MAG TPA: Abi-alpha family protein [Bryobacteraceae bacterium]|jgi:hypothetical protein